MQQILVLYTIAQWVLRLGMMLIILRRRYHPVSATAWLMLIFFLPEVGVLMYLLFGHHQLSRRRLQLHRKHVEALHARNHLAILNTYLVQVAEHPNPQQKVVMRQSEGVGGMPTVAGNHVELMGDGNIFLERLIADINAATHHVHLLFYIYANDKTGSRVAQALIAAAGRGVKCRLLADAAGSFKFFKSDLPDKMRAAGVQVVAALPVAPIRRKLARLDLRNHRKIAVIDGNVAYTGSQNIIDANYGHRRAGAWIDLMGRFTGPIVNQLQAVFIDDWAFDHAEEVEGDQYFPLLTPKGEMLAQCVPTGPNYESETFRHVLLTAINASREKLIMTSPYIVLDEPTIVALSMAAQRGVDVNIVLPHMCDHPLVSLAGKAYYEDLLSDGVKIYLYRNGMLHSKTMSVDDNFALLGTANLDVRSFFLNFEVNVMMYGEQITREMRFAQMAYINESDLLTLEHWSKRPHYRRYLESAAALFSPLL